MVVQLLGIAARVGGAALARHGAASALRALDDKPVRMPRINMTLSVESNIKEVAQYLNHIQLRQLPFATSKALNDTAWQARAALMAQAPKKMDRPTPFTVKDFRVKRATKRDLDAIVYVAGTTGLKGSEADRTKYMTFVVDGGIRLPERKAVAVPVNVKQNKYGNMGRKQIATLLNKSNTFSGVPRGQRWNQSDAGIWQRGNDSGGTWTAQRKTRGKTIKMLVAWEPQTKHEKRFPFYDIAGGVVRSRFRGNFKVALTRALRTAR